MDFGFKGKKALVTGAGSQIGFGKEIAMTLAREGCDFIAVTDINLENTKLTAKALADMGVKSLAVKADITKEAEVNAMVKKVVDTFGAIDILCNVAGGVFVGPGPFEEQLTSDWERDAALNMYGALFVTRAVLPFMKKQKKGVIVNIGSGSTHQWSHGVNMYAIAKSAIDEFTKQLAFIEAPNNIRANCVAPGPSPTNFIKAPDKQAVVEMMRHEMPLNRITTAADIANATVFLASDVTSPEITGQVLHVSGGSVIC